MAENLFRVLYTVPFTMSNAITWEDVSTEQKCGPGGVSRKEVVLLVAFLDHLVKALQNNIVPNLVLADQNLNHLGAVTLRDVPHGFFVQPKH
ncbi:hypothetical protein HJFPF1_10315 [Paramyrothecium foliicola]|nr:hypothetical protein HJFPF1_10315 [Paramyrothecium foliicola]